jgi:hypothetical protein
MWKADTNDMAREEGTYILMVDVFYGQRVLCFPLSYYDGEAYLLGLDDDFCGPFGQPISNFGLLNEEEIVEEIAKTSPEYSASKMYWSNYRLKRLKLDYGKCYHSIYRPKFLYTSYLDASESIPNGILSTELYADLPINNFQEYSNQLRQLEIILDDVAEVFKVVAPHHNQFSVYGHAIRNNIILACTELDARMQSILVNNRVEPIGNYFDMKDYLKLKEPLRLGEYQLSFYRYGDLGTFSPFSTWESDEQLFWYQAYNHIKHNREKHFAEAKLFNAINAIMAYAIILIAQYGYRNNLWRETIGKIIHIDKEPKWDMEDFYIKNPEGQRTVPYPFQQGE